MAATPDVPTPPLVTLDQAYRLLRAEALIRYWRSCDYDLDLLLEHGRFDPAGPTLFHTTAHASEILDGGFRDGSGSYGFVGIELSGVFLSASPADVNDGAKGDQVLAVTFPASFDLDQFAIVEDGRPVWEWLVPASVLNRVATVRLLT